MLVLGEANLDRAFLEAHASLLLAEMGDGLAHYVEFLLPLQVLEIILVAATKPFGNIVGVQVDAVFGHFVDDLFIGFFLVQELVDYFSQFLWELGDFALGPGTAVWVEVRIGVFRTGVGLDRGGIRFGYRRQFRGLKFCS